MTALIVALFALAGVNLLALFTAPLLIGRTPKRWTASMVIMRMVLTALLVSFYVLVALTLMGVTR